MMFVNVTALILGKLQALPEQRYLCVVEAFVPRPAGGNERTASTGDVPHSYLSNVFQTKVKLNRCYIPSRAAELMVSEVSSL